MKKAVKITLVVASIVIILGGAGAFVGTLLYTQNNVDYTVGESTITDFILFEFPDYVGFIVSETPINITNNGLYPIRDLVISLTVFGDDFSLTPSLNGLLLGEGVNSLGDIAVGATWSGTLAVNMTEEIALLAINDGSMVIHVDISLKLDFGIFKMPFTSTEIQTNPWDSPF